MRHPVVLRAERAAEWREHLRRRCGGGEARPLRRRVFLITQVVVAVCEYYGLTPDGLKEKTREGEVVRCRMIAMYLARKYTGRPYPVIGRELGGFDHSTVIHAERRVAEMITTNPEVRTDVDEISGALLDGW